MLFRGDQTACGRWLAPLPSALGFGTLPRRHTDALNVRKLLRPLKTLTRRKVLTSGRRRTVLLVLGGNRPCIMYNCEQEDQHRKCPSRSSTPLIVAALLPPYEESFPLPSDIPARAPSCQRRPKMEAERAENLVKNPNKPHSASTTGNHVCQAFFSLFWGVRAGL
jgi:hypothetical protein